ncbi:hypothetical protein [Pseudidiomarina terrestris]|uniref:hypothetical protein n=1 Tax=Pseudidiomarina terrestris TaxID=2820060 RepID=UPI00264E8C48|nr:hypothetical protein [Pseudidiomarina sp. 1ASP75-5]MDN7135352.1 hypothetical protein [Pseudidiomarina sp. 1ASP75-5]
MREDNRNERIYNFQAQQLPSLFRIETEEQRKRVESFFADLQSSDFTGLRFFTRELVDRDYEKALKPTYFDEPNALLLEFESPSRVPLPYFAAILPRDGEYLFFVFERSIEGTSEQPDGMLCKWDNNGRHLNFGRREYTDPQSFLHDVIENFADYSDYDFDYLSQLLVQE